MRNIQTDRREHNYCFCLANNLPWCTFCVSGQSVNALAPSLPHYEGVIVAHRLSMCTDTPQRYLRRILVSDFKQTKRWPIIPSLRRCQCSPPPAYLSMCTDTPQRYLRRILILDFKQKNAGRPFSFQNRFSLLWQPCLWKLKGG